MLLPGRGSWLVECLSDLELAALLAAWWVTVVAVCLLAGALAPYWNTGVHINALS
jgi:hypothetical protein